MRKEIQGLIQAARDRPRRELRGRSLHRRSGFQDMPAEQVRAIARRGAAKRWGRQPEPPQPEPSPLERRIAAMDRMLARWERT